MRRADRLFEIVQLLRGASAPTTAAVIAGELEVTVRTVYRDISALQARRVPIEGERGIGYILRKGFSLPPLMFSADEIDAIAVGARLVRRIRDPNLQQAAARVLSKVTAIVPDALRAHLAAAPLYVSDGEAVVPHAVDLAAVRHAIHEFRKIRISYADESGNFTRRTIWPIAMAYYVDVTLIAAWCELRKDYRHFRVERIQSSEILEEKFPADNGRLLSRWLALQNARSGESDAPRARARAV